MKPMFKFICYQSAVVVVSLGLGFVSTSYQPPAMAQGTNNSPQQERTNQEQPASSSEANRQSPQTGTEQTANDNDRRDDDRVYISDIYPEYCRSYFLRRDYVSLNEYYAGMTRCKYGNDRWFF